MTYCDRHRYTMPITECPVCVREERDRLRALCAETVQSFDILIQETPIGKSAVARGIVQGAFIGTIGRLRKETGIKAPDMNLAAEIQRCINASAGIKAGGSVAQ